MAKAVSSDLPNCLRLAPVAPPGRSLAATAPPPAFWLARSRPIAATSKDPARAGPCQDNPTLAGRQRPALPGLVGMHDHLFYALPPNGAENRSMIDVALNRPGMNGFAAF